MRRAIEYIEAGDVFQVNLSQRLAAALAAATRLRCTRGFARRARRRSWRSSRLGGADVVSASPERFLRRARRSAIETRPIKGTRPRGTRAGGGRRARRGARVERQGPRRERDDRRPRAQRPRPRRALRIVAVADSVRARAPSRRAPPRLDRRGAAARRRPAPAEILRATFPPGSVTGRAQGPGARDHRGARAGRAAAPTAARSAGSIPAAISSSRSRSGRSSPRGPAPARRRRRRPTPTRRTSGRRRCTRRRACWKRQEES